MKAGAVVRVDGKLRIGLIGLGFMGGVHLAAILRSEGGELRGVAARRPPQRSVGAKGNLQVESAEVPDGTPWHADWRELVANPEIDAIDICTPSPLHKEIALAALGAGKHVLCEKPMALDTSDCAEMMRAADSSGRVFMVAYVVRFMEAYRRARLFIERVGRDAVRSCCFYRRTGLPAWGGWLTDAAQSGGAVVDLLSHDLDQVLSLFGTPAAMRAERFGAGDTLKALLTYPSGLTATVQGGWYGAGEPFAAGFTIETGDETLVYEDGTLTLRAPAGERAIPLSADDPYLAQMNYFIGSCRSGQSPALCPPAESAAALEISVALRRLRDGQ